MHVRRGRCRASSSDTVFRRFRPYLTLPRCGQHVECAVLDEIVPRLVHRDPQPRVACRRSNTKAVFEDCFHATSRSSSSHQRHQPRRAPERFQGVARRRSMRAMRSSSSARCSRTAASAPAGLRTDRLQRSRGREAARPPTTVDAPDDGGPVTLLQSKEPAAGLPRADAAHVAATSSANRRLPSTSGLGRSDTLSEPRFLEESRRPSPRGTAGGQASPGRREGDAARPAPARSPVPKR